MFTTSNLGMFVLRLGLGLSLASHGFGKLMSFSEHSASFPDPLGIGPVFSMALVVFAEFFCSLAVVFGFLTRWAAIPVIISMAVAVFKIHATDDWATKELATLYGIGFLAISLLGSGRISLDSLIFKKR